MTILGIAVAAAGALWCLITTVLMYRHRLTDARIAVHLAAGNLTLTIGSLIGGPLWISLISGSAVAVSLIAWRRYVLRERVITEATHG
mgnify:CR=1 FL=1